MGRRSRKSKRKMNSLFMALLLSAILLIMSTYAWFTANRVVTINGITAKVTVAEGLQISLDGQNWSNSITANASVLNALGTVTKDNNTINVNNWIWPSELKPVSCDGILNSNLPVFKDGNITTDGVTLNGITTVTPNYGATVTTDSTTGEISKGDKLIAFDVYLRNTSGQTGSDTFQLGTGSKVALLSSDDGGVEGTGLEYSSRVGVLLYGGNVSTSAQDQYNICNIAASGAKFAIWEPNYQLHISDTDAMDGRITGTTDPYLTYAVKSTQSAQNIENVLNNADTTNLSVVKTTYSTVANTTADMNLNDASTGTVEGATVTGATALTLPRNAVSKATIYIWLEGQDPDCNDYASAGGGLQYVIKFTKPPQNNG